MPSKKRTNFTFRRFVLDDPDLARMKQLYENAGMSQVANMLVEAWQGGLEIKLTFNEQYGFSAMVFNNETEEMTIISNPDASKALFQLGFMIAEDIITFGVSPNGERASW